MSLAELIAVVDESGFSLQSRPSKTISDAL
jgi:hypothetical protein